MFLASLAEPHGDRQTALTITLRKKIDHAPAGEGGDEIAACGLPGSGDGGADLARGDATAAEAWAISGITAELNSCLLSDDEYVF